MARPNLIEQERRCALTSPELRDIYRGYDCYSIVPSIQRAVAGCERLAGRPGIDRCRRDETRSPKRGAACYNPRMQARARLLPGEGCAKESAAPIGRRRAKAVHRAWLVTRTLLGMLASGKPAARVPCVSSVKLRLGRNYRPSGSVTFVPAGGVNAKVRGSIGARVSFE